MLIYFEKPQPPFPENSFPPLPSTPPINLIFFSNNTPSENPPSLFPDKDPLPLNTQFNESNLRHNLSHLLDESKNNTPYLNSFDPSSSNNSGNFINTSQEKTHPNEKTLNPINTSSSHSNNQSDPSFHTSQIFNHDYSENSNVLKQPNGTTTNINIINFNDNSNNIFITEAFSGLKGTIVNNGLLYSGNSNVKKNEMHESKYAQMSIREITAQLTGISKKQTGCRFLQRMILSSKEDIVNMYFYPSLYPVKILELCQDFFGNYFIQKMIPKLSPQNLNSFTSLLISHLMKLCVDSHGTRVIQSLNAHLIATPFLLNQFTKSLIPLFPQLINDHNGSFVLMSYARVVPYPQNNIVFDFLYKNIIEAATQPYACCTLQKCIDIGNEEQRTNLLKAIANFSIHLISNQYGNYVIQFVLSKRNLQINDSICASILPNILYLSKQKYSSNVIEKCFDFCSQQMKGILIKQLCNDEIIRELIKDMYGNYVLQKAAMNADEKTRKIFLNVIINEIGNLQYLTFGQKLITKLILTFPELRNYNNNMNYNNQMFALNQQMMGLNIGNKGNQMQQQNMYNMMGMNEGMFGNLWNQGFYMSNIRKGGNM